MKGADVFFGLSVKGAVTKAMVKSMADKPIIFAMANPDPEITPEEVRSVRKDAIIATGRCDYPNQINNVLGFPYIFRGALDVRARTINEEMKIAAAEALAKLAREDVPDEVDRAYSGRRLRYGPEYVMPVPFDPRLISTVSVGGRARRRWIPAWRAGRSPTWRSTAARSPAASIRPATGCRACSSRSRPTRSASSSPRARRSAPSAPPWCSATTATARRS